MSEEDKKVLFGQTAAQHGESLRRGRRFCDHFQARGKAQGRLGRAEKAAACAAGNAALAGTTDDRILACMAQRIFCAGFVWRVIEQKWPGFEAGFLGFIPQG